MEIKMKKIQTIIKMEVTITIKIENTINLDKQII
jgi:hypothetical protein